MLQSTKYKILIYSLIGAILLTLLGFWIYFSSAQARDYQRLSDLKVWQNILADHYAKNGTYAVDNCSTGDLISKCLQMTVGRTVINNIHDPVNYSPYQYVVQSLSDTDYEISFSLEAGIGDLSPGKYIWTKSGVRR